MFGIAAVCLVLTAGLASVNHEYVGPPVTIGAMVTSLALSLMIVGPDATGAGESLFNDGLDVAVFSTAGQGLTLGRVIRTVVTRPVAANHE